MWKFVLSAFAIAGLFSALLWYGIGEQKQTNERLFESGRDAALHGVPVAANPYSQSLSSHAEMWARGWIEGFKESQKR